MEQGDNTISVNFNVEEHETSLNYHIEKVISRQLKLGRRNLLSILSSVGLSTMSVSQKSILGAITCKIIVVSILTQNQVI